MVVLRPQEGPQEQFLSTSADIAIYGGAAGGGKSWALLLEALRHHQHRGFGAVIFRRTFPEIKHEGGLWDESMKVFPLARGTPRESSVEWVWPQYGTSVKFAHMQHEKNRLDWGGSQITYIGFDELCLFTRLQFFFMLSRNRSSCGIRPYIRATCNPDSTSWVKEFISWWIDPETGYAIPERSGKIRWFIRKGDDILWASDPGELPEQKALDGTIIKPMSMTFIAAKVTDNKELLTVNPSYLSSLYALPRMEREQLLNGNWKVKRIAGTYFRREWFRKIKHAPEGGTDVRYWDRAATEEVDGNDPDWTVGVKMRRLPGPKFIVVDVVRFRSRPADVERRIVQTAHTDGSDCKIVLEQDPGSAGKAEVSYLTRALSGFNVRTNKVTTAKTKRALPYSAQAEQTNVEIVEGDWNEAYFDELEVFDDEDAHDDQVDASSGAFNELCAVGAPGIRTLGVRN